MSRNSRKQLDKAYENLFNRIYDLESISTNKIKELSVASDFFDLKTSDMKSLKDKVVQMSNEIEDLERSLAEANKKIDDLKQENEFLNEKNSLYVDKIFKFKSQGSKLIAAVEEQMEEIKDRIKSKLK
jgi:hypothetical protein